MPHRIDNYKSPNSSTSIELDPNNNGSTVRKAFQIEVLLNMFSLPLLTHPHTILPYLLNDPTQITPATIVLARAFGGIVVAGLNSALLTGVPNTKTAIESRRTVYLTLGMGEVILIPLFVVEAMKGGSKDAALNVKTCLASIASLLPLLIWRFYVLYVKPEMIGRYREIKRE